MWHRAGILVLVLALSGCLLQPGGSGNIIPGNETGETPGAIPEYTPLADQPGEPLPEGVECGSQVNIPVDFGAVGYSAPAEFLDITENEFVAACRDSNMRVPDATCDACGWSCAVESPYFYRFSSYDNEAGPAILTVHIWDLQCGDLGLEYRLPGQGAGEGVKVTAIYESDAT